MNPGTLVAVLLAVAAAAREDAASRLPAPGSAVATGGAESGPPPIEDRVVVSASRAETKVLEAPTAVTVVTSEDLEHRPSDDLGDVLRRVPGLNVVSFGARDVNVNARGAASSLAHSQLVLVDGRSVYQDFFGFVFWDALPVSLDEVDRIEVIRGPASAVWGANAMTGVIHILTRPPRKDAGTSRVAAVGGEEGTLGGSFFHAAAPSDLWAWKVSGGWRRRDAGERDDGHLENGLHLPEFPNRGTEQPKLDVRADRETAGGARLTFAGGAAGTSGLIFSGLGPFDIRRGTTTGYARFARKKGAVETQVFLNTTDGDASNLLTELPVDFRVRTLDGSHRIERILAGRHRLVAGGNVRLNRFDIGITPGEDRRDEAGVFAETEMALGRRCLLTTGARLDWNREIGATLSPRTSLVVRTGKDRTFRVSASRAFRTPSLVNNYLDAPLTLCEDFGTFGELCWPAHATGDPELREERLTALEAGWSGLLGRKLLLTVSVYANRTRDLVDFHETAYWSRIDPPPGWPFPPNAVPADFFPKSFGYRNVGEIVDLGAEVSADVSATRRLAFGFQWAWQNPPRVESSGGEEPLVVNVPPRHRAGVHADWSGSRFDASLGADAQERAFFSDVLDSRYWGETDPFVTLAGSFAVRMREGRLRLGVRGTNLLDREVKHHVWGDRIGRLVTAELAVRF